MSPGRGRGAAVTARGGVLVPAVPGRVDRRIERAPSASTPCESQEPTATAPTETDPVLRFFEWLVSGKVSNWEAEMTRRAGRRLA
jgi:hypothetical protein